MMKQKKRSARIVSLALSAVMVCTMLPTIAFAAEGTEDDLPNVTGNEQILLSQEKTATSRTTFLDLQTYGTVTDTNGTTLTPTEGVYDMIEREGWKFDKTQNVLTLEGANIAASVEGTPTIMMSSDAKIVLVGENFVSSEKNSVISNGTGNLTIEGDGTLTGEAKEACVTASNNLIVNGGTLNLTSKSNTVLHAANQDIEISDGTLNLATEAGSAIHAQTGNIEITGGTVTASGFYCGLSANGSASSCISISDATVIATSSNDCAIFTIGNLDISDSADVTATDSRYAGMNASGNITIADSTVAVAGGTNPDNGNRYPAIFTPNTLVIGGTSKVTANGDYMGIRADTSITINGTANVTAAGQDEALISKSTNILGDAVVQATSTTKSAISGSENLSITENADVTARGEVCGILAAQTLVLSAKDVKAYSSTNAAVCNAAQNITIGGKLTAESRDQSAIYSVGNITADDKADIRAVGNWCGIQSDGNITFTGSTVDALGNNDDGIYSKGTILIDGGSIHAKTSGLPIHAAIRTKAVQVSSEEAASKVILLNLIEKNGGKVAFTSWAAISDEQTSWTSFIAKGDTALTTNDDGTIANALAEVWLQPIPAYTGTQTTAPTATKTHNTVTLNTQAIDGETVEYGIENPDGTITWQDSPTFSGLNPNTEYKFYTRVKESGTHKAGATSASTAITTKPAPTTVSGNVKDGAGNDLAGAIVTLVPSNPEIKAITDSSGNYTLTDVPAGTYSLVVKNGDTTITDKINVAGTPITGKNMQFLSGDMNTVVDPKPGAPDVAVGGMIDLLNTSNIGTTLTADEKAAVDASGSVELKFTADLRTATDVAADKSKIEAIAGSQKIDLLLDLSVLKTVKDGAGTTISNGTKITTLADLIEVYLPIPANLQGKAGLALYRVHNGTAQALGTTADSNGEYYTIDSSGEFMTLFVKNFSTYALGYNAFTVTLSGGGSDATGAGNYSNGDTVTINAGSKSGYTFDGWTVTPNTVVLANPSSASTTFTMPSENVTVTASWKSDGGGGGGGGSTTTTYPNTVNQPENGAVSIAPKSPSKGQTVTITTKPDAGYVVDTVIVKDANGKTIAVTEKGVNSYTFVQPAGKVTVEVTYTKAQTSGAHAFTDVAANDWFYDAVMAATANGWFSGTSDTTFSPNAPTNRGMIATILHRMENTPGAAAASFADVASDAYYANGVAWAQAHSIVKGYDNGNYGPNDSITREQLAAILYRYANYKGYDVSKTAALGSFADASGVSGYAEDAMSWAVGSGLISGRENNTLAPTVTATRAEVAVILVRFEELLAK